MRASTWKRGASIGNGKRELEKGEFTANAKTVTTCENKVDNLNLYLFSIWVYIL